MSVKHISSGSAFEDTIGYSRAVIDDNYVFVSGTTGYDYDSMSISDDIAEQADQCFRNIDKALRQAGSSLDHVVRVRYILSTNENLDTCWPVFKKYLDRARPAATLFIGQLLDDKMKLEIEVTARVLK
jgi:enamine deaminase RidA (YjgF/YER057c/UK114 family)